MRTRGSAWGAWGNHRRVLLRNWSIHRFAQREAHLGAVPVGLNAARHLIKVVEHGGLVPFVSELDLRHSVVAHHLGILINGLWPFARLDDIPDRGVVQVFDALIEVSHRKLGAAPAALFVLPVVDHAPSGSTGGTRE
eukprot:520049-Prymnesium_polylepis.1